MSREGSRGTSRVAQRLKDRRGAVALVAAFGVVVALGAWAWLGDVPFVTNPFRTPNVPSYLEPDHPDVRKAAAEARDGRTVVAVVRHSMRDSLPGLDALWRTETGYGSQANVALWLESRQVRLGSFEPFNVPLDPTWSEDPYDDIAWQADYQGLAWLRAPAGAYAARGDETQLEAVKSYLLDWIADADPDRPPSVRTWYDHAVAYRTDVIVELLATGLWDALSDDELATVLRSLEEHGRRLDGYLSDAAFHGHNHNLFHALSLYSLAAALPQLNHAADWRADARERVSSLLPEMVDMNEGVSLEEAAAYHFLALRLFASADRFLDGHHDPLAADERAVLGRMTGFGALLLSPNLELPAVGDTNYASTSGVRTLRDVQDLGIGSGIAEYLLSGGLAGSRPPDAAFFPKTGYAIVRPAYTPGDGWSSDLQLVVDTTSASRVHGHDDVMNVLLSAAGGPLLVDSGGPFVYGNRARQDFVGAWAHNGVIDLDAGSPRGTATDVVMEDYASHTVVAGSYRLGEGIDARRSVIVLKPGTVVILDRLYATDGRNHRVELLFHLPPGAIVDAAGSAGTVAAGPAGMGYRVVAAGELEASVVTGEEHSRLGWVTRGYGRRDAAPVLRFGQEAGSTWFVTVLRPSPGGASAPTFGAHEVARELSVRLEEPRVEIRADAEGLITVVPW